MRCGSTRLARRRISISPFDRPPANQLRPTISSRPCGSEAPEGGSRFPVDARLDGRTFVTFHVDLGVGDDVIEPLDRIVGEDWLGFAGIPTIAVPTLSTEQHWAEKLHAYTLPRDGAAATQVNRAVQSLGDGVETGS